VVFAQFLNLMARYSGAAIWQTAARAYARRLYRLLSLGRYDLLWIEKEALPFLPAGFERFLFGSIPYVIDIDDAWFFKYSNHRLHPIRHLLGGKFGELVRRSALTIVGNSYLGAWAKANGAPVVQLLPTVVDIVHYPPRPPAAAPFTIGWIGTPMTVRYLEHIAEPLRQICDGRTARLRIIGDTNFRLPGVACVNDAWQEATEAELISQCHIGIMPAPRRSVDPRQVRLQAYPISGGRQGRGDDPDRGQPRDPWRRQGGVSGGDER
jgi:hypothetical protein